MRSSWITQVGPSSHQCLQETGGEAKAEAGTEAMRPRVLARMEPLKAGGGRQDPPSQGPADAWMLDLGPRALATGSVGLVTAALATPCFAPGETQEEGHPLSLAQRTRGKWEISHSG